MKKATIFAAALALLLSLAACGNRDDNGGQTANNGQTNSGQTNSGQTNSGQTNNGQTNNGQTNNGAVGNDGIDGQGTGTRTIPNNGSQTRSQVGNDLRRAADGVGNAVTDLADDGRDMLNRAASASSFERMLDNARVHDTDGVLTDGENSRW